MFWRDVVEERNIEVLRKFAGLVLWGFADLTPVESKTNLLSREHAGDVEYICYYMFWCSVESDTNLLSREHAEDVEYICSDVTS